MIRCLLALALAAAAALACHLPGVADPELCPIAGARPVDHLIERGERHFARLWQITQGGENAEGYWSFAGDRLVLQRRFGEAKCDRIFVTESGAQGLELRQVSDGRGVTTCSYFLPGDGSIVFASTGSAMQDCPPPADHSQGYTWPVHPEYDLWVHDLATGTERRLTAEHGYDAEATVSPRGDRMVFTSTRSGDLELWTCDLDGGNLRQVTDALGYDGGGFFSHDGERIVFRSTQFTSEAAAELAAEQARYRELLLDWKVRPHSMELMLVDADGTNRRALTHLGGANFAPFFFPDDQRVIFSSDHHVQGVQGPINFDLFAIDVDGGALERITTYAGFDSFPMFSPHGRFLVFASNRGGTEPGETNLFVARWR
jgi:hypothetical protein